VRGTRDRRLFKTSRWQPAAGPVLDYRLPLADGRYRVRFYFAELDKSAFRKGRRVFHVRMEGRRVHRRLDVYALAGARRALITSARVAVRDGRLDMEFVPVRGNPELRAIEVTPVSGGRQTASAGLGGSAPGAETASAGSAGSAATTGTASAGSGGSTATTATASAGSGGSTAPAETAGTGSAASGPPGVPVGLAGQAEGPSTVSLSWQAPQGPAVAGYRIYRDGVQIARQSAASYVDSGLSPVTRYSYQVAAYDPQGQRSARSDPVGVTTPAAAVQGSAAVTLSWLPPTLNVDGSPLTGLAGFKIRYGQAPGRSDTVAKVPDPTASGWVIEGLSPGTYYFTVIAYTRGGLESAPSNEVSKQIVR